MTEARTEALKLAARGRHGVVVSHTAEAAVLGARVLEQGGTAIDAAIAMSFATAVRETAMSGIGGAGVLIAHTAAGEIVEVNFYGRTPRALPEDVFVPFLLPPGEERMEFGWLGTRGDVSQRGPLSVGVPAFPAGLATAHARLAKAPWGELLAPAVELARTGFDLDPEDLTFLVAFSSELYRSPEAARIFLPDGLAAAATSRLRQPELAETVERIRVEGADRFYAGELGERIAAHVEQLGGYLSPIDMREYEPALGPGLRGDYQDCEVVTSSGSMGGVTLLQMLNLAEQLEVGKLQHNSGLYLHLLAELMRQAWTDRFLFVGNPEAPDSVEDVLIDKDYARSLAASLPTERVPELTRPGAPHAFAGRRPGPGVGTDPAGDMSGPHTTNIVAADIEGNVATVIQTLGQCYGSCVAAPGTGTLLCDMTYWLNPAPGTPNSVGPAKRPAGHATPVLLLREGRPVLALGAPGGRKIVTSILQVILNVVDFGMDVQAAIAAPRIHCEGADPAAPRGPARRGLDIDARIDAVVVAELEARGHEVERHRDSPTRIPFGRPLGVELREDELLGGVDVPGKSVGIGV